MINTYDILETVKMIQEENLDIRTITMGISLRDLAASDVRVLGDKIYDKVTSYASRLVATGETIERELGIPIINKRISVTPIAMLRQKGIAARPAVTNKLDPRLKAVEHFLNKEGRLMVSDACTKLIAGFSGGYRYARVRGASGRVFKPEPEKNEASHIADAAQYACLEYLNGLEAQATRERYRAGQRPTGSVKLA